MRRSAVAVILMGSLASVGRAWGEVCDKVIVVCRPIRDTIYEFWSPPFKLATSTDELIRADLRQPQPFAAAQPTERSVRPTRDQRPALRFFTLPRADFAS